MQFQLKTGQSLAEPITISELKTYIGYSATDQDSYLTTLITSVRKWVENYTCLSAIEKVYEVAFERGDDLEGWFTLPIAPVLTVDSVQINAVDIEYDEIGLTQVKIYPYTSIGWQGINVEYTAGETDNIEILKDCIYAICAATFVNKTDMVIGKDIKNKLNAIRIPVI